MGAHYLEKTQAGTAALCVPGDKSISHRALMFAAIAGGESRICGLLEGEDALSTAAALRALGAHIKKDGDAYIVRGVSGAEAFRAPGAALDFGNAGTAARLMMGLLAPCAFDIEMTGDASLRKRPMKRATEPLARMGASFRYLKEDGKLPLVMRGGTLSPLAYVMQTPSAQVKSAILLAGLRARGITEIIEPTETRDHSEKMLKAFGADIRIDADDAGRRRIRLAASQLTPCDINVPGDPSSGAFPALYALLAGDGREIILPGLCANPHRIGFYRAIERMGAHVAFTNRRQSGGEDIADVTIKSGILRGIDTAPEDAPAMIDEFPALAMLAAVAKGESRLRGLGELKVKESDRFAAIIDGLSACGVSARAEGDDIIITGSAGAPPKGGAAIAANLDHRVAMAYLIFGIACERPVYVDDISSIATSFPDFAGAMRQLGGEMRHSDRP